MCNRHIWARFSISSVFWILESVSGARTSAIWALVGIQLVFDSRCSMGKYWPVQGLTCPICAHFFGNGDEETTWNNCHKIPQLIMFCCATSWCTVAFQKPRSEWHKLPSTNGLPRNMFLPFCRLPLSSSLRLFLDWYYRSPRGRVYSTLKQQGRLPWIFASAWFVFPVSGIFYLIWHDVIPLTLLLAKALIISAASFMLILPLDKIEDSAKPRLCQRRVLSASKCENGIDMVRLPGCWESTWIHLVQCDIFMRFTHTGIRDLRGTGRIFKSLACIGSDTSRFLPARLC